MKTISFAAILLAGAAAFSGVARADETTTAVNQESARVVHPSAPTIWGAPAAETRYLGVPHHAAGTGAVIASSDQAFISQGNRGVGNN